MLFNSYSLKGCFIHQFGQNKARGVLASSCAFLICTVIIWAERVLRISALTFSNKFPIFALVSPPPIDFCIWVETSQTILLPLNDPLEHLRQIFIISTNGSCDISPFPNRFRVSRKSSLIPRIRIVFKISWSKLLCLDL